MLNEKRRYYLENDAKFKFPKFYTLSLDEASKHEAHIKSIFGFDESSNALDVQRKVMKASNLVRGVQADNHEFNFLDLLKSQNIEPQSELFIDWHQFNKIDRISVKAFSDFFDDIWYPNSDDIYLYDDSYRWFILVMHHGAILVCKK
ncbi:hypothetical protein J6I90_08970 [Pseudidiomarina sp. 1APP75-32.1]|uniref:Uncharacterized protein n=1 Tax=Pseudidiomarina terrestris TaxID=2820060 RepID=A0AAW7QXQ9_9GAMM|nr:MULTISPECIES: hypothetical protein [unclassified Pseudidiomarina]MDN7125015.1 hypothetical protein [Pseudidiomarina sp. 1APP75-32.1]MDN7129510.1 hypothetical protein [Pseudidiomarina sp. 1APR75-15]